MLTSASANAALKHRNERGDCLCKVISMRTLAFSSERGCELPCKAFKALNVDFPYNGKKKKKQTMLVLFLGGGRGRSAVTQKVHLSSQGDR